MGMKTSFLISLFIGVVLIGTTVNGINGITDIPRDSVLFTVSMSTGGLAACLLFIHNRPFLRITGVDLFMTVLFILFLCTHYPLISLWNVSCFALFFIYLGIRFAGNIWNYTLLYIAVLLAIFILSLTGYLQYLGLLSSNSPYFRLTGPYRNSTIYAGMLCLLMIFPTIWLLFSGYHRRYPKLCHISIFVIVLGAPLLVATACRSAWLAFAVVISLYIAKLYYHSGRWRWKQLCCWGTGILLITSMTYGLYCLKVDSADGRLFIWKITSQMVRDKPITGFGAGGFATHYMHYQAAYLKSGGSDRERFLADSNHTVYNEPLRLVVEYGLVGLLLYIGFVYVALKSPASRNIVTVSVRFVLIAALIWGLFAYPDQAYPMLFVMLLALAFLSVQVAKKMKCFKLSVSFFRYTQLVYLIIAFVLCFKVNKQYHAHRAFHDLLYYSATEQSDIFITGCCSFEILLGDEASFWILYCTVLDKREYDQVLKDKIFHWEQLYPTPDTYIVKGDLLQRLGESEEAEAAYWLAHNMMPSRQKARSRLALLYRKQGRMKEAVDMVHEILSEKVKVYGFETYRIHEELKRIFENQY